MFGWFKKSRPLAPEHALVSRSSASAQEKLARAVKQEQPARSAEEWYALNVPR